MHLYAWTYNTPLSLATNIWLLFPFTFSLFWSACVQSGLGSRDTSAPLGMEQLFTVPVLRCISHRLSGRCASSAPDEKVGVLCCMGHEPNVDFQVSFVNRQEFFRLLEGVLICPECLVWVSGLDVLGR